MSRSRRETWAWVLSSHRFSPSVAWSRPVLAPMMATGVFSSWEASVTNCRWRSRFSTKGRITRPDSTTSSTKTMTTQASEASTEIRSTLLAP